MSRPGKRAKLAESTELCAEKFCKSTSLLNSPDPRFVCERCDQGRRWTRGGRAKGCVRNDTAARYDGGWFWARLRRDGPGTSSSEARGLAAVDGEGDGAERILEGPAAGQVEADAASGLAQSSADFEQLGRRVSICAERQGWGN